MVDFISPEHYHPLKSTIHLNLATLRKYLQILHLIKDGYPEYITTQQQNNKQSNLKMSKGLKQTFLQRRSTTPTHQSQSHANIMEACRLPRESASPTALHSHESAFPPSSRNPAGAGQCGAPWVQPQGDAQSATVPPCGRTGERREVWAGANLGPGGGRNSVPPQLVCRDFLRLRH